MKNIGKSTRTRLIGSALAMLLCVAMLVGTTFAWFSDEAKTGETTITAGNLDVDIVDGDNASLQDKEIFDLDGFLWEPGAMFTSVPFAIANNGTLALKYALRVEAENTGAEGVQNILERVKWKVARELSDTPTTQGERQNLWESIPDGAGETAAQGVLPPRTQSELLQVVLYWEPADSVVVGDPEANPDNLYNLPKDRYDESAPSASFRLDVLATQAPYESDSFGIDYDENIELSAIHSQEELDEALAGAQDGDDILLGSGSFGLPQTLPQADITISGEGADETVIHVTTDYDTASHKNGFDLSPGKGHTVTFSNLKFDGTDIPNDSHNHVLSFREGNLVLDHVEITGGGKQEYSTSLAVGGAESLTIKNSTISGATYGIYVEPAGVNLVIEDSTIEAAYVIGQDDPGTTLFVKNSTFKGGRTVCYGNSTFENVTFLKSTNLGGFPLKSQLIGNSVATFSSPLVTFTGCNFSGGFYVTARGGTSTVNFSGCKNNDADVTSENVYNLIKPQIGSTPEGDNGNLTVQIDGEVVPKG